MLKEDWQNLVTGKKARKECDLTAEFSPHLPDEMWKDVSIANSTE